MGCCGSCKVREMQKLTVEQRDWLIEQFNKTDYRNWEYPENWVEDILNQCTEGEDNGT